MNKERINRLRRENRARKKAERMKDRYCLLCEIKMENHSKGMKLYCNICNEFNKEEVAKHRWRRYYHSKLKKSNGRGIRTR